MVIHDDYSIIDDMVKESISAEPYEKILFIDDEKLFVGAFIKENDNEKLVNFETIITKAQFLMAFNNWILPYIHNDLLR